MRERRLTQIDVVKAAAIVAVVFTHAGPMGKSTPAEELLRSVWVPFHVPAFLMVSGFLCSRPTPLSFRDVGRRISRYLVPYLIASALAYVVVIPPATSAGAVLFRLATGSTLGIYYFLFVLTWCLLAAWPLSRVTREQAVGVSIALWAYAIAAAFLPELRIGKGLFWSMRDPTNFFLAYFATGWVSALYTPEIAALPRDRRVGLLALAGVVAAIWALELYWVAGPWHQVARAFYAVSAAAILVGVGTVIPTSAATRFLSDATLGIYLYHNMFVLAAEPRVMSWPPVVRTLALVCIGLGGGAALCLGARLLLGRRWARSLVGA